MHAYAIAAIDIDAQPVATATVVVAAAIAAGPIDTVADTVELAIAFATEAQRRTATTGVVAPPAAVAVTVAVAVNVVASSAIATQLIRTTLDRPLTGHALAASVRR